MGAMRTKKKFVGKLILDSLTPGQVAGLLDVIATSGDLARNLDRLGKSDPDVAATVAGILESQDSKHGDRPKGRVVSRRRLKADWDSLWRKWHDIVSEVGDEDGKYAVQDVHWDPPYFDDYKLAADLEPIAGEMLLILDDIFDEVDEPDLFMDAIQEIAHNIAQYPEWMGAEYGEPCALGENVTRCVLNWMWRAAERTATPGIAMVQKIRDVQESCESVKLDSKVSQEFFGDLPGDVGRDIFTYLSSEPDRFDLENVFSAWHLIYHQYQRRFDPAKYLETCRTHLAQNWRYGRPLIEEALGHKDYRSAEDLLEKTFAVYLGNRKKKPWHPELSLLLHESYDFLGNGKQEIVDLLSRWTNVAKQLGNAAREAAAEMQIVILRSTEDWETVIKQYKRLVNPKVSRALEPLFNQWQTEMALRSLPFHEAADKGLDTWIHWLIEAELDVRGKRQWFGDKVNAWLEDLRRDANAFKNQWPWLACLTGDLPGGERIRKSWPAFYEVVVFADDPVGRELVKSRRAAVNNMKVAKLRALIMEVWKTHLIRIIPDPAQAHKSEYAGHAAWAKALQDLNLEAYDKLLARWRKKHNRRRNLWRDMQAAGLPI
jgi:hypothetical protein